MEVLEAVAVVDNLMDPIQLQWLWEAAEVEDITARAEDTAEEPSNLTSAALSQSMEQLQLTEEMVEDTFTEPEVVQEDQYLSPRTPLLGLTLPVQSRPMEATPEIAAAEMAREEELLFSIHQVIPSRDQLQLPKEPEGNRRIMAPIFLLILETMTYILRALKDGGHILA
jgi:hypothetical protein